MNYLQPLITEFDKNKKPEKASGMAKYMRNQFKFYGLYADERNEIFKKFIKNTGLPDRNNINLIIEQMWNNDFREMQYSAIQLYKQFQKINKPDDLQIIEFIITHKSWWDTVDSIAPYIVQKHFELFPDQQAAIIDKWLNSSNIWLQRSCLIFQLLMKEKTDIDLLFTNIEKLKNIDEFFIQKAIGWSLRQYSKINPNLIQTYVNKNNFSNFVSREALRHINRQKKIT